MKRKKVCLIALSCISLASGATFVACDNNEEKEFLDVNKKSVEQSEAVSGNFIMTTNDKVEHMLYILNGRLISCTNLTTGKIYKAPQEVICDSSYPCTDAGMKAAANRADILKEKYGMPCADSYLVYNKDKGTREVIVLYSKDGPCDWMNEILQ